MAKLYFYYSAMNAGKSTTLLQSAYNYNERGMAALIFAPGIDIRYGSNLVTSRIGLSAPAVSFHDEFNFFDYIQQQLPSMPTLSCVLVDEAQFLSKAQVLQLTDIVDKIKLPVLAFGIRSDFQGEPFPGSLALLVWADNIVELKTICFCGKKAIMNSRIDEAGNIVRQGAQIAIGGNQEYIATCRYHFKTLINVKNT